MNHGDAARLREELNDKEYVEGPGEDAGDHCFSLVRAQQPGYLNQEPMYEVLLEVTDAESIHFPADFLELVTGRGCYLRLTDGTVHIRDWET